MFASKFMETGLDGRFFCNKLWRQNLKCVLTGHRSPSSPARRDRRRNLAFFPCRWTNRLGPQQPLRRGLLVPVPHGLLLSPFPPLTGFWFQAFVLNAQAVDYLTRLLQAIIWSLTDRQGTIHLSVLVARQNSRKVSSVQLSIF